MTQNIYEEGSNLILSISVWGNRAKVKIPKEMTDADPVLLRLSKKLIDPEHVKPIEQVRNKARSWIDSHSLDFPISGIVFVPTRMITQIDAKLRKFQEEFDEKVADFAHHHYDLAKNEIRLRLNGLFNEADYPDDITSKFEFSWKFMHLAAPNAMSIINPEILQREQDNFVRMMGEFRDNAVNVLRIRFSEMVARIVDRLSGEEKRFKNTTITNIQEFLNCFDDLNINNDMELQSEVARVKSILAGVDPKAIRTDAGFKASIAREMSKVHEKLETMMENIPRRKLLLNRDEDEAEAKAAA